jgi:hypothetical protein
VYPKSDHQPAFTILNFEVDNVDQAADELARQSPLRADTWQGRSR